MKLVFCPKLMRYYGLRAGSISGAEGEVEIEKRPDGHAFSKAAAYMILLFQGGEAYLYQTINLINVSRAVRHIVPN